MRLPIEEWMEKNKLSEEISDVFNDAVLCYKNGIYRASLIMTYTAFFKLLKERLMNSSGPSIYPASEWATIQREIQDDDIWEKKVFDLTQQGEKNRGGTVTHLPVFSIKQGVRDQLKYWKDRRNDCAHHKRNFIGHYHVESFWAFISSNSSRITVEGGKDSLLNKIRDNYNISITPAGTDITPLVEEIENSVDFNDLGAFWNPCFLLINRHYDIMPDEGLYRFIEKVFAVSNDSVKDSLVSFLKTSEPHLMMSYLAEYPQRITNLKFTSPEIRQFWRDKLISKPYRLSIFAVMLNTRLIPDAEQDEAIDRIIASFSDNAEYSIKPELNYILTDHGFTEKFENRFFTIDEFKFYNTTNSRSRFLGGFLDVNGFNLNTVQLLCHEYGRTDYQSNFLLNYIERIFTEKPERKTMFRKIADDNTIGIPAKIADLLV